MGQANESEVLVCFNLGVWLQVQIIRALLWVHKSYIFTDAFAIIKTTETSSWKARVKIAQVNAGNRIAYSWLKLNRAKDWFSTWTGMIDKGIVGIQTLISF